MELVATVIHELAHNTLYVKSQTPFNESFASFVGYRGRKPSSVPAEDTADAKRAAARWRDERTLDVLWAELARRLDSALRRAAVRARPRAGADDAVRLGAGATHGPVGQSLETYDWRWFARAPLNNAVVIAQRLYRMNLNLFEEIYVHSGAKPDRDDPRDSTAGVHATGDGSVPGAVFEAGLPADD